MYLLQLLKSKKMKWHNLLIIALVVVGLSILLGYQLKKCPACSHDVPVYINIDSITQAQENDRKVFQHKIDSLKSELSRKPTKIIIHENCKDSTGHVDTCHIPAIFRKLADHFN